MSTDATSSADAPVEEPGNWTAGIRRAAQRDWPYDRMMPSDEPAYVARAFYLFNGSAFAGLGANTDFYNVALAVAMALGRLLPICFVLALAGSLAQQGRAPANAGTLPTHRPQFVLLTAGVVVIVAGLTFVPALALGPLAEGLS